MNNRKRRILHELGFRKSLEENRNKLVSKKIDFNQLNTQFHEGLAEEAKKQNQNAEEVILNE